MKALGGSDLIVGTIGDEICATQGDGFVAEEGVCQYGVELEGFGIGHGVAAITVGPFGSGGISFIVGFGNAGFLVFTGNPPGERPVRADVLRDAVNLASV